MSKAKLESKCPQCGGTIKVGEDIYWSPKGFVCDTCKPQGKAKVAAAAHHVSQSPLMKAAKALLIAALTFFTAWFGVKTEALSSGRDKRDVDMVRYEKVLEEQRTIIIDQGQRIAFLEGRFAQRDTWTRNAQPRAVSDVKATDAEVKAYQDQKKD